MTRRSTPQPQIDERAYPVRILIRVPDRGFGRAMPEMHQWLVDRLGHADFAWHSHNGPAAVYFRDPRPAVEFLDAFPAVELADDTTAPWYTSPYLPQGRPPEDEDVCYEYENTLGQAAIIQIAKAMTITDRAGNVSPGPYYPDTTAPIIRHGSGGLVLAKARWGMPSPPSILKTERDPGVGNVRNLTSPHWRRWLGPAHRCLVPVTSFAEPRPGGSRQWFGPAQPGTPMFFAGIQVQGWESVRKVKDGPSVDDLFAFLTTEANKEVAAIHPKAMPVLLTRPADWETWLTAPIEIARTLQRPASDGTLVLIDGPV